MKPAAERGKPLRMERVEAKVRDTFTQISINMKIAAFSIFICTLLILGCSKKEYPVVFDKSNSHSYTIIISADANNHEKRAADIFRSYIAKSVGSDLKIQIDSVVKSEHEILIGYTNRTSEKGMPLKDDGFRVRTKGSCLVIEGIGKGIIYGVVDFLEKYAGCNMLAPGEEFIQVTEKLEIPELDYSDAPVNSLRIIHTSYKSNELFKDWMRTHDISDMFADGYYVHTFNKLVPWLEYFKNHPDYYAYMNGKRIIDQLCMSNPDVLEIVLKKLEKDMAEQPDKIVWSVSQNDNFSYCQCDKCNKIIEEEGNPTGPLIRFVNQVAAHFPDKIISTLAYQFSRHAPLKTKPAENVQIMLCTIELNRSKSIIDDPESASFVEDLKNWGKISKNIYLWDYTIDFAHSVSPFPNLHVLQPNIQLFKKNDAYQHFQQNNTQSGNDFSELKFYMISKLLWNPDVNIDSVKNVFIQAYYGDAAPLIAEYLDLLTENMIKSGDRLDIYEPPTVHATTFLSSEKMDAYEKIFDKAENAVSKNPELLKRVEKQRLPIMYAAMEIGKSDMFGSKGWYQETNGKFILNERMKQMLEDFNRICKENSVTSLNESGLTPEIYYNSTLRFIDVKTENNLAFRKPVSADPLPASKYSQGDLSLITNGVQGANDFKVHWLGWEDQDFKLTVDLKNISDIHKIQISSLWDPKSWILHPAEVACEISTDGKTWKTAGVQKTAGDQKQENVSREFVFTGNFNATKFIRFSVKGTHKLPDWHPSAGGASWVFVDEIIAE